MKEINNYVSDSIPDLNENRTYAGIAASIGTLVQPVNGGFQWIFLKDPEDRDQWNDAATDLSKAGRSIAEIQKCDHHSHSDSDHRWFL